MKQQENGFGDSGAGSSGNGDKRTELLPLTPAQRGMWFADRLSPQYSVNTAQYVEISHAPGGLDIDLLMDCSYTVGREMESPYIRLTEVDGVPMQYVDPDYEQPIQVLDFRGESDPHTAAVDWMLAEYRRPVDLIEDQLVLMAIIRVADDRTIWYQRAHHLVIDGYAALTLLRRILDHYNAARTGRQIQSKPVATLSEIVEYEDTYRTSTRRETDRAHWLERVSDLPERVTLSRSPATAPLSFDNVVAGRTLTADQQARFVALAGELNTSLAVLLASAFGAFLARMSGSDDIALSLPITGRANAKIKRSGGMVSNVVPIRLSAVSGQTARELIKATLLELTGALRHQRYRSDDIRRDAGLDSGSMSFGPTINMVFFDDELQIEGAELEYRILASGVLEDLLINVYQSSPEAPLVVDLHGNPHLYAAAEIDAHLDRFLQFMDRFAAGLDVPVAELDLLMPGEAETIGGWESGPTVAWSEEMVGRGHLLDSFLAHARDTPEKTAVLDGDRSWSYREFDRLRVDLAQRMAAAGIGIGDHVAVDVARSAEQVLVVYAALSLGAVFVPIDPELPAARRDLILGVADPRLVVDADWLDSSGFRADRPVVAAGHTLPASPGGAAAAYVIFTSGSTGRPKGVQVSHEAVLNRLAWVHQVYPLSIDDVWMYKTPATFDPSVIELFWPLQRGASLVIAEPGGHRDPAYLRSLIAATGVTVMHFVPSMLDVFADAAPADEPVFPRSLRRVFASGEALPAALADRVLAGGSTELVNLYGPTEAAVDVTRHRLRVGERIVPIGTVVENTRAYVLTSRLKQVPAFVSGELYLAGVQLADGYAGAGALTSERFVADPFVAGARMYRTGDLVRWNELGELEYLGRTDFQVKVRGQRVELGEIEQTLGTSDAVDGVAVLVRESSAGQVIVGYVRPAAETVSRDGLVEDLLRSARRSLPGYMVPSAIVLLDEFPVTDSGKLDRRALPDPPAAPAREAEYRAPESDLEVRLVELLAELLGVEQIGMGDNIFALGADSLIAARLVARARTRIGVELGVGEVLSSTDVADIVGTARPLRTESTRPLLVPQPRPDRIPVSHPQARLWFINRLDPSAPTYNMPGAVRLQGDVDEPALRAAAADLIRRHESLRTRFPAVEGEPVQEIASVEQAIEQIALTIHRVGDSELESVLVGEAAKGFDLVAEFPVRFALVEVTDDANVVSHVLTVVLHHIAGDGASLAPLITDLLTAYAARAAGTVPGWDRLPVQYADFTLWSRELLGTRDDDQSRLSRELDFWTRELEGSPDMLPLPVDHVRSGPTTGAGGYVDLVLEAQTVRRLRELARGQGVTTFTVLHSALAVLLSRVTGSEDISIGTAVAGRDEPELAGLIGMFVNTVVLRTGVRPADTVADVLKHAHRVRSSALVHSAAPFEAVVEAAGRPRSLSHSPLFQVALTLITDYAHVLGSADIDFVDIRPPVAKYDLSVSATEAVDADRISLEFSFATDIFAESTVSRLAEYLERIIEAMTADATAHVGSIVLLPDSELAALTVPPVGVPPQSLRTLLGESMKNRIPGAMAVAGSEKISNELFAMRTNQLARELVARRVGPGDVVAIAMARSELSVLSCVAVAKTGAAFVSIDPRHPADRQQMMLSLSGARVGITVRDAIPAGDTGAADADGIDWLVLDDEAFELQIAGHSGTEIADGELLRPVHVDDPAYLIFTSGSTGHPKATMVPNRGLANVMDNQRRVFGLHEGARVLHVASPSFDASVFELAMAVSGRCALVVADVNTYAGHDLERLIAGQGVTHAVMTPSALATLDPSAVPSLQTVLSAGEACPAELMRRWVDAGRRFYNLYGPTETTIWATYDGPVRIDDEITIGGAVDGVGTLVLDAGLQPVPVGVVGELYLSGEQLVLGYLHRMPKTAVSFVANPYVAGERMYRTGDRVVRGADGRLIYRGRSDFQLKVRGMRVEPGEVDSVLEAHPTVASAMSLGVDGPAGESVLVAYVTAVDGATIAPDDLLRHAGDVLPSHMVPHTVMVVDEFPMTVVGKVDRTRLPAVDFRTTTAFIPPRNELEAVIAEVYAQVLGVDRVSVQDSFFELGGSSLSAAKLASHLSQVLDRTVSVTAVFEGGTVAGVAAAVTALSTGYAGQALIARPRAELVPVSDVQRGMWLINQAAPESPAYNIAMALRLEGRLDHAALVDAVADLVEHQESLRTSFPIVGGRPVQLIEPAEKVLAALDLTPHPVTEDDLAGAVAAVTGRGFDVAQTAPIRVALLQLTEDDHVIVFVIHHIAADGASMAPLAHDFMTAYLARHAGHAPSWLPLRVQYADFAEWQRERLDSTDENGVAERDRQLGYWRDRLAGAPEVIELPTDRPRPAAQSFLGATVDFELPGELVAGLQALARRHNTTLFVVTHAAFALLLARLTGRRDVVIGTPYAGRDQSVLDDVVGMFVNTLALRSQVGSGEKFSELLERTRTEDLADMGHADVPFDAVVTAMKTRPSAAFNPVFQVMFTFQNLYFPAVSLEGLTISPISEELSAAKVDLQLTLFPNDPVPTGEQTPNGPMRAQFLYAKDLFDESTVRKYVRRYRKVLEIIVADPEVIVGDISIVIDEEGTAASDDHTPLGALVAAAALSAPTTTAISDSGAEVSFSVLSATASALAAAIPDADAALTTAVMTLAPGIAASGPERLGEVLEELRRRAVAAGNETTNEPTSCPGEGTIQRP